MIRKGIFGGTFDPIHIGHMYIANEALWSLGLDKVIFMPSGIPPHKSLKGITPSELRFDMVSRAIKNYKNFEISDYEIRKNGYSYTYETLEYLKGLEGNNTELYFITGCDCLFDLDKWRNVDRIMKAAKFVVFNRPGYSKEDIQRQKKSVEEKFNCNITFLDLLLLDISSTYIRQCIKEGKDVSFFLPMGVEVLIKEKRLYLK
ncbi:nicotinate-nucleotide adenylyltransferase [Clostridium thermarum]|uniref:nicotinate-nucleotide adenylyltransferase n=1 Tax=Clostridium thermarum TaxID=1716543 RepID=UPI00111FBC1A|nr:nicotinate-nucleotide adenylyltransferase [Clostridium thermarum]